MEVDLGEGGDDLEEKIGLGEARDLAFEFELVDGVAGGGRDVVEVGVEVVGEVGRVVEEAGEVDRLVL